MSLLIAFSGQGAQHHNMFNILTEDIFGKTWLKAASVLINIDLLDKTAVEKACLDVIQVQRLNVILSVGIFQSLKRQLKIEPAFLCGYSLGEISAFSVSANLDLKTICELVTKRAEVMQNAMSVYPAAGGLAVVKGKINIGQIQKLLEEHTCYIAIINADDHFIIGGLLTNVDALLLEAKQLGVVKAERLAVKLPSHTPLLAEATDRFLQYLQCISTHFMQYPILNALTNELILNSEDMLPILAKELSQTLHWDKVMRIAKEYGISSFLEIGPGASLKNMMLVNFPQIRAYNSESFATLNGLLAFVNKF